MTHDFAPTLVIADDAGHLARLAARALLTRLETPKTGEMRVILPTGHTPLGLYRELATDHADRRDLWDRFHYMALDEYAGLPDGDHRLFSQWLDREILGPLSIPANKRTLFRSDAPDPVAECARINAVLNDRPVDVAVLGLGTNGHIGFNEPGSAFSSTTRPVTLTPESIAANASYWGGADHVPKTAMTLGLKNILAARSVILLVQGAHKADILHRVLNGAIDPSVPASGLRMRPDVTVIADRAAIAAKA